MKRWQVDVPVLLIFFVREEVLQKVFDSIRNARPSVLLLWQDGPRRNNPDDLIAIMKCRRIVEKIDWDCKVYTNYHEENMGCDPSTFLAQKWAFSIVDKCIVMEDDRVPAPSFYRYCKELLDKYEFDERINHICGTNILGENKECDGDYFFAPAGSTTWASWKRVADTWDEVYSYLDDRYAMQCLKHIKSKAEYKLLKKNAIRHRDTGKQYWETILGMSCLLNNRLAIIPKKNMVQDLGLTENSTHAVSNVNLLPRFARKMFYMPVSDVDSPLSHPKYVMPDYNYYNRILKSAGVGRPILCFFRKVDYLLRCLLNGEFTRIFKSIYRRFK